jgi:electron transfer flavoprotein beta subunit
MNIVVLIKQVPDTYSERTLRSADGILDRAATDPVLDEINERAVEAALRLKEAHGGEVTMLCMGPAPAADAIRKALSMGADQAVHLSDDALAGSCAVQTARALAQVIKTLPGVDLILAGNGASDGRVAAVPAMVADVLDLPALTHARQITVDGTTVTVRRETDRGAVGLTAELPAVISVSEKINEPRYPSFKGIMAAKKKPVAALSVVDAGIAAADAGLASALTTVTSVTPRPPKSAGQGAVGTELVYTRFKQAAKLLGWNVTSLYPALPTPQDLQQALNQAIQLHPDAVVIAAVDDSDFQTQINTLHSMHIPVIADFSPDPTGGPITLSLMGAAGQAALTRVAGAKAVADLGGQGELGIIGLQGYKIVQEYDAGFYAEVRQTCPACTIKETDLPLTSLGTTDGSDIVNFLRANPGIKALMLGYDGVGSDLYTAAKSAGITLPKIYSSATLPTGVQAALEGELTATVPMDYNDLGWRDADALARIFTGQTASALTQDVMYERPVIWSEQYHNVPSLPSDNSFPGVLTSYQAQYEKLWGK